MAELTPGLTGTLVARGEYAAGVEGLGEVGSPDSRQLSSSVERGFGLRGGWWRLWRW